MLLGQPQLMHTHSVCLPSLPFGFLLFWKDMLFPVAKYNIEAVFVNNFYSNKQK